MSDRSAVGRSGAAKLLGVAVDAPASDVQRAFRTAVKDVHPDGGGTDGEAFVELHAARELLLAGADVADDSEAVESTATADADPSRATESNAAHTEAADVDVQSERPSGSIDDVGHDQPSRSGSSSLFARGVLLIAAGLGLLIGLLVAAAVVAGNDTQSVRIAPVADAPEECLVVSAGAIEAASCDAAGALSIASRTATSAACASGTTRLEIPNGDTFCLRPKVED